MKRTPLYDKHLSLSAKMAPFGGYEMPIQYEGIVVEHEAARNKVAIFDTCHMGEFTIEGAGAVADLENLLSCSVGSIKVGQCRYGFLCNPQGGVIDDQILYRRSENAFMMVVNAGTCEGDFEWIQSQLSSATKAVNLTHETAKIDIQGPQSARLVAHLTGAALEGLGYYRFIEFEAFGVPCVLSRTGYTGELGFELYCPSEIIGGVWDRCLELGAKPVGLGARDTLRLEMGFPLYGHELSQSRNAAESGFARAIDTTKDFIGSSVLKDQAQAPKRLVALKLADRRAAREGAAILDTNGASVGVVTSGSYAPSVGTAVALGYVDQKLSQGGTELMLDCGRAKLLALVSALPFYDKATGRLPITQFL